MTLESIGLTENKNLVLGKHSESMPLGIKLKAWAMTWQMKISKEFLLNLKTWLIRKSKYMIEILTLIAKEAVHGSKDLYLG